MLHFHLVRVRCRFDVKLWLIHRLGNMKVAALNVRLGTCPSLLRLEAGSDHLFRQHVMLHGHLVRVHSSFDLQLFLIPSFREYWLATLHGRLEQQFTAPAWSTSIR